MKRITFIFILSILTFSMLGQYYYSSFGSSPTPSTQIIYAVNFYKFSDQVSADGWTNVDVPNPNVVDTWATDLINFQTDIADPAVNLDCIEAPSTGGWTGSGGTFPTAPVAFDVNAIKRGVHVHTTVDTIGFRITNLDPSTTYEIAFFARTTLSGSNNQLNVITSSDVFEFFGLKQNASTTFSFEVTSDVSGNLDFYFVEVGGATANLGIFCFYVYEFL